MIGILGGTFDPIHNGHLCMAWEALEKYDLKQVRFIPCNQPVHKKISPVSAEHRLNMIQLALETENNLKKFILDKREISRTAPSYMLTTLQDLHQTMPNEKFGLILGTDAMENFTAWHGWKEILSLCELLVMPRYLLISSTSIRYMFKINKNPYYLMPECVINYIKKYHLYI